MDTKWKRRSRRQRGMTLIEIMVVITILGLLAAAIGIAVVPQLNQAKVDTATLEIRTIDSALELYYTKKGKYPDTGAGLKALVDAQALKDLKPDPWGNEYLYLLEGGKPVVSSYGQDGAAGGEGLDADISNKAGSKKP